MGRDVQRDCSEIHLLVSLDTGQYKKEACEEEEERRKGGKRYGCEYGYAETLLVRSYHISQTRLRQGDVSDIYGKMSTFCNFGRNFLWSKGA